MNHDLFRPSLTPLDEPDSFRRPWNPAAALMITLIFGIGAGGLLATVNFYRMGRSVWILPTLLATLAWIGVTALLFELDVEAARERSAQSPPTEVQPTESSSRVSPTRASRSAEESTPPPRDGTSVGADADAEVSEASDDKSWPWFAINRLGAVLVALLPFRVQRRRFELWRGIARDEKAPSVLLWLFLLGAGFVGELLLFLVALDPIRDALR